MAHLQLIYLLKHGDFPVRFFVCLPEGIGYEPPFMAQNIPANIGFV